MPAPKRIAATTLALQKQIAQAVPAGVEVTTLAPAAAEQFVPGSEPPARVNLTLVQVSVPAASISQVPLRPGGMPGGPALIPLELVYLVTCYANASPSAERSVEHLMEAVLQRFHTHPILDAAELNAAAPDAGISAGAHVVFESEPPSDLRKIFIECGAKWRPALFYRVRLNS